MLPAREKAIHLLLILAFAAAAVAPMLVFGIPGGNDGVQHFEFAQQVVDAIKGGDVFPSFAAYSNHGFGDVGLRIYPPAAYYLLAFAFFLVGSWSWASVIVFFLIFLSGALGVYLWVCESFSPKTAITAAGLFTVMPFHLNEIYNNFLYAQFAASAVLPFCLLFTARVIKRGRLIDSIGLAASFALLVITHLPLTIIGSIALGIYAITMLDRERPRQLAMLAGSVLTGLGMSSFYWVRMVTEMGWVKHSAPQFFADTWSFSENYLFSQRTITEFLSDDLALWFGDLILLVTFLICVPSLVYFVRRDENRKSIWPVMIVLGIAIVMTTPLSAPIWDSLPVLQKVQFPWRWLSVVSLMGSVFAADGFVKIAAELKETNSKTLMLGISAAVLPFVIVSVFIVKAPHYTSNAEFDKGAERFSSGETFEGWWPKWARREAFSDGDKAFVPGRAVTIGKWLPLDRTVDIGPGEPGRGTVNTFYYPHWIVGIDGRRADVRPDPLGLISFDVPGDAVTVSLRFEEPPLVRMSMWLSLACWLAAASTLLIILSKRVKDHGKYR